MLSSISWQTYWFTTCVILAVYYLFILGMFYQKEILGLLTGERSKPKSPSLPAPAGNLMGSIQGTSENNEPAGSERPKTLPLEDIEFFDPPSPDDPYDNEASQKDAFDSLEQLSLELKSLMKAYRKKGNRTELIKMTHDKLMLFSKDNDAEQFKDVLNSFITEQSRDLCGIRLEPADWKVLWHKDPL